MEGLEDVVEGIKALINFFNPLSDKFFLKVAFVPTNGYWAEYATDIRASFEGKVPLISQLTDFFIEIKDISFNEEKPSWSIELPSQYGGQVVEVLDLSMYDEYRSYILNFIRFSSWFIFLKNLYRKLPSIVY